MTHRWDGGIPFRIGIPGAVITFVSVARSG